MNNPDHNVNRNMISAKRLSIWQLVLLTSFLFGFFAICHAEENSLESPAAQPANEVGTVARAVFTSQIIDREPVDSLSKFYNKTNRIYFFTDLRGLAGQIVTHKWEHDGQVMAEIKFKVGSGSRWRVYSSKNLLPTWTGQWTVSVIDENGEPLNVSIFNYVTAPAADDSPSGNQ